MDVHHYKDKKTRTSNLEEFEKLIVCVNSLSRTQTKLYDIVVVDEIETFLNKWFNNTTLNKCMFDCWTKFLDVIKAAKKVIFLDAFTSNITMNFINGFDINTTKIYKTPNPIEELREINILKNRNHWIQNIINELNDDKKVFIFYPYKTGNTHNVSLMSIKNLLEKQTGKKGIAYTSEIDDDILKGLKDVNTTWSQSDFIITNSKITVGINYELTDFNSVYISLAGFTSIRDAIQVSYRCRTLQSNTINICFLDKCNTFKGCERDTSEVKLCPIYNKLIEDIEIEKRVPLMDGFLFLCSLAHYKVNEQNKIIEPVIDNFLEKFVFTDEF
jgi:hypothetical protein